MSNSTSANYTAFAGIRCIATGDLRQVAAGVREFFDAEPVRDVLIFDDASAHLVDVDFRGTADDVVNRLPETPEPAPDTNNAGESDPEAPRGPGRPKLGVVAREITLLPRHWDWLNTQTGGASVALRKLVEEARRASIGKDRIRLAQEASYRFMSAAISGKFDFEEANRALFAGDGKRFDELIDAWPPDLRDYLKRLAHPAFERGDASAS